MRYSPYALTAATLLLANCNGPADPTTVPDLNAAGGVSVVFWDPFGGSTGESLDERRPPQGGGTWQVEWGPATLWKGSARLEDATLGEQTPDCSDFYPLDWCDDPVPGRLSLWLDEQLHGKHEVQFTVLDLDILGEGINIFSADAITGLIAWDIAFDAGNGFISLNADPFIVLLPIEDMATGGDYTVTIRVEKSTSWTYSVDIVGHLPNGGRVSSHTDGMAFDDVPGPGGRIGVIAFDAWEPQPEDGIRMRDFRIRAERLTATSLK